MKTTATLIALTAVVSAGPNNNAEKTKFQQLMAWKDKYSKDWKTEEDFKKSEAQWMKTDKEIKEQNDKLVKGKGIRLAHNKFSDMTNEEFAKNRGGVLPEQAEDHMKDAFTNNGRKLQASGNSVNWFEAGKTGEVLDQGDCASCYAFSSNMVLASTLSIVNDTPYQRLSEQAALDCTHQGQSFAYAYNMGCYGGYMQFIWGWSSIYGAMPYEADSTTGYAGYEYTGSYDGSCNYNPAHTVPETQGITFGSIDTTQEIIDRLQVGTVDVGLSHACTAFQQYAGGVVTAAMTEAAGCDPSSVGHAAVIVGYNAGGQCGRTTTTVETCTAADLGEIAAGQCADSAEYFLSASNECCSSTVDEVIEDCGPTFLIQNQYGEGWGEAGFLEVAVESTGYGAFGMHRMLEYVNL